MKTLNILCKPIPSALIGLLVCIKLKVSAVDCVELPYKNCTACNNFKFAAEARLSCT